MKKYLMKKVICIRGGKRAKKNRCKVKEDGAE